MYYSIIVLLAIMILFIENNDILLKRGDSSNSPPLKMYRRFLLAVLVYYTSDILWGVIEYLKLPTLLYIDTLFYFVALAGSLLFWTQFAVTYINSQSKLGRVLVNIGRGFFAVFLLEVIVNPFYPLLFSIDKNSAYIAKPLRHVMLVLQILLFALVSLHALVNMLKGSGSIKQRYRTIAFSGFIVAAFLTIQLWFPYLPLYTIAYMLGICMLHTFVINGEKEAVTEELKNALAREKKHYKELLDARVLAYKDSLTGVKSKLAYAEFESEKNSDIQNGRNLDFSVAVFDVNGLKEVNDTLGHERGDQFIIDACMIICRHFKHSPVFRIGGDEFVVLLERDDFDNRAALADSFNQNMDSPDSSEQPIIIAMGMTDFISGSDASFNDVFVRADKLMYERKHELKNSRSV